MGHAPKQWDLPITLLTEGVCVYKQLIMKAKLTTKEAFHTSYWAQFESTATQYGSWTCWIPLLSAWALISPCVPGLKQYRKCLLFPSNLPRMVVILKCIYLQWENGRMCTFSKSFVVTFGELQFKCMFILIHVFSDLMWTKICKFDRFRIANRLISAYRSPGHKSKVLRE